MTLEQIGLCIFGLFIVIAIVATISSGEGKPRRNKRTGLPAPSDKCKRSPDWRSYELKTPRSYIP